MPCRKLKFGRNTAIICGRGQRRHYCFYCRRPSEFQCDFPIGKYKSGKKKGQNRDCDRHLCAFHTRKGVSENVDFCREHFGPAKAAYERRTAREKEKI